MASDSFNGSSSSFMLVGVPGLEAFSTCLGILFCSAYVLAAVGHGAVLLVLGRDRALQAPSFLAMLALPDVLTVTAVAPEPPSVLWLGSAAIGHAARFLQMFPARSRTAEASGVLLAVALDPCVAICHPPRRRRLLGGRAVCQAGPAVAPRAVLCAVALTGLLTAPPCRGCPTPTASAWPWLARPAPAPPPLERGLVSLLVATGAAPMAVSYGVILRAVLGKASLRKALSTRGCRLRAAPLSDVPGMRPSAASGRAGPAGRPYLTLPAVPNPWRTA